MTQTRRQLYFKTLFLLGSSIFISFFTHKGWQYSTFSIYSPGTDTKYSSSNQVARVDEKERTTPTDSLSPPTSGLVDMWLNPTGRKLGRQVREPLRYHYCECYFPHYKMNLWSWDFLKNFSRWFCISFRFYEVTQLGFHLVCLNCCHVFFICIRLVFFNNYSVIFYFNGCVKFWVK